MRRFAARQLRYTTLSRRLSILNYDKDMGAIREEMKTKEAIKEAEQKKKGMKRALGNTGPTSGTSSRHLKFFFNHFSQDKIADAKAKAAVKAQIEADKRARAEKAAREKALRQNPQQEALVTSQEPAKPVTSSAGVSSKEYKETRLQVNDTTFFCYYLIYRNFFSDPTRIWWPAIHNNSP